MGGGSVNVADLSDTRSEERGRVGVKLSLSCLFYKLKILPSMCCDRIPFFAATRGNKKYFAIFISVCLSIWSRCMIMLGLIFSTAEKIQFLLHLSLLECTISRLRNILVNYSKSLWNHWVGKPRLSVTGPEVKRTQVSLSETLNLSVVRLLLCSWSSALRSKVKWQIPCGQQHRNTITEEKIRWIEIL